MLHKQAGVVTGAGSGIGRAIALALACQGMRLLLVGRRVDKLRSVAAELGGNADILSVDLRMPEAFARIAEAAADPLHLLVHAAGIYQEGDVTQLPPAAQRELDAVNLHAPLLLTASCLPALKAAKGSVVFVNSSAALRPNAATGAYSASKAALRAATDTLRQEINIYGVRVLSVFPGRTDTPMQATVLAAEGRSAPPGTLISPDDIAAILVAAISLPHTVEVTDIMMRPSRRL